MSGATRKAIRMRHSREITNALSRLADLQRRLAQAQAQHDRELIVKWNLLIERTAARLEDLRRDTPLRTQSGVIRARRVNGSQ